MFMFINLSSVIFGYVLFFGSDRSPRKANLRSFVRSFHICLEQSNFIFLAQFFKQSVRNQSAVNEHSESTLKALIENSESTQERASIEHS